MLPCFANEGRWFVNMTSSVDVNASFVNRCHVATARHFTESLSMPRGDLMSTIWVFTLIVRSSSHPAL